MFVHEGYNPCFLRWRCVFCIYRYSLSNEELNELLPHLPDILVKDPLTAVQSEALRCPYPASVLCSPGDLYRTYDGRCNNFRRPLWGASHQPLARFLQPHYADGKTRNETSSFRHNELKKTA